MAFISEDIVKNMHKTEVWAGRYNECCKIQKLYSQIAPWESYSAISKENEFPLSLFEADFDCLHRVPVDNIQAAHCAEAPRYSSFLGAFQQSDPVSQSFLHPESSTWSFPARELLPPTTLQGFQLLPPQDDIQPRVPVHLQSTRVSHYCIFSLDVPSDMAIPDGGHESKVLNHPVSWCVQQVPLSNTPHGVGA